ncbi:nitrate- and nitrite sensing domain-containing protein [Plantactinospora sp. WMMC1484]|uniref:sensor histidine kinase n=1 Tax=Plantactinospora sp. WMMC1484 TaxID=3404122 RepID=UPI003BF51E17
MRAVARRLATLGSGLRRPAPRSSGAAGPAEGRTPKDPGPTEAHTPKGPGPTEAHTPKDGGPAGGRVPAASEPAAGPVPTRIVATGAALLVVLALLWGYATFLTARDAMDLLAVRTLGTELGQPTDALILDLQAERRLSMVELAAPGRHRAALRDQRTRTDDATVALRRFTDQSDLRLATAGAVRERAAELVRRLDDLRSLRDDVDAGRINRATTAAAYAKIIDAGFAVYGSQWTSRRSDLLEETRALLALSRAAELLAREDALVAGALASSRLTEAEHTRLADLVAVARFARTEAAAGLPDAERAGYDRLVSGPLFGALNAVETELLAADWAGASPPVQPARWQAVTEPALAELRTLVTTGVRDSVGRATRGAAGVAARAGLVGGLGLVLLVAAAVLTLRGTRRIVARLDELGSGQAALSTDRDKLVAERNRLAAQLAAQRDRTATLTDRTAELSAQRKRLATQREQLVAQTGRRQAETERVTERAAQIAARLAAHQRAREVTVWLTRGNQNLLHRQIGLLDALERRETDTEDLAELFRLDHLATRIRRNVEQLISLSGGTPGRRWRRPVPLVDIVRGAVAEVSDYPRVLVAPNWPGSVAGRALPDLIHLLAELIEAALGGSAPTTTVRVAGGEARSGGRAIIVSDDGAGRSPAELDAVNALIRDTPHAGPLNGALGMYVVGRLARRHGITVELTAGPRGGTTATVLVPATLLVEESTPEPTPAPGTTTAPGRPADSTVGQRRGAPRPGPAPDALPVRVRRPDHDTPVGTQGRAAGSAQNGAPARRTETDWSATLELPVALPAPSDDRPGSSERTTGDSRSGHDG